MQQDTKAEWEKVDPRADDLEIQTLSDKIDHESGIKVTYLYFTSHKIDSKPVRIYGIYARPAFVKGTIPALLFIHGGGQMADEQEVVAMARQGYAAFSHDWKRSESHDLSNHANRWPFDEQGRRLRADDYLDSPPWIARRALTLLEQQPEVDANRIGIYGFSWGGHHSWTVAATDARVKVASPSCGIHTSPQPFMERLGVPVLLTNASNDFFALLDMAQQSMAAINVEHRTLISPNENHNLAGTGWEVTRQKWFDHYLKGGAPLPPAPIMSAKTTDDLTMVAVTAPAATECQLIYSYGAHAAADRCWFGKPMQQSAQGVFTIALPRCAGEDIWYFANCDYPDGVTLSTNYAVLKAESTQPAASSRTRRVLYDPAADGPNPWYFSWRGPVADHPWHSWGGTILVVSPDVAGRPALHVKSDLPGQAGFGLFKAFLRSPACPLRKGADAKALSVDVVGQRPLRITVGAYSHGNWTAAGVPFQATVELTSGQGWSTISIPLVAFKRWDEATQSEATMSSFADVQQFHLTIESADQTRSLPAIGLIQWVFLKKTMHS